MGENTYYHSDTCNLPCLEELFKGKAHLEILLNGRRWSRVKVRIMKLRRLKRKIGRKGNLE